MYSEHEEQADSQNSIQAKLNIASPDDPQEKEADAVSNQVLQRTTLPAALEQEGTQDSIHSYLEAGDKEQIQAKTDKSSSSGEGHKVASVIRSPGTGTHVSENARSRIEPILGADLSQVRIHSDAFAQQAAGEINAKAFTHKNHIYLGAQQSAEDLGLIAHEATHVRQQGTGQGLIRRAPAEPSAKVWVNTNTGVYHAEGSQFYGKTQKGEYMALKQAEASGYRLAGSGQINKTTGAYRTQRFTGKNPRIVIDSWLGPGQTRQGFEKRMASAAEYGLEELAGWERAHSQGAGVGAESPEGIRLAPRVVNQALQNRGIEQAMRDLEAIKPKGAKIHLRTVTKTHTGTLRLREIHYEISVKLPGEDKTRTVFRTVIKVDKDGTARPGVAWGGTDEYTYGPKLKPPPEEGGTVEPGKTASTKTSPTLKTKSASAAKMKPGMKQRVLSRIGGLRTRLGGRFKGLGGNLRRVGGRGIGVIIAMGLGLLVGYLEGKRQERSLKLKAKWIEKEVTNWMSNAEYCALAMQVRHPGKKLYLQVQTTFTEEFMAVHVGGGDVFEDTSYDLELDSIKLSTENDNSKTNSSGHKGGGTIDYEITTTSMPLEIVELPTLEELHGYAKRSKALLSVAGTSIKSQFARAELEKLDTAISSYQDTSSGDESWGPLGILALNIHGISILNSLDDLGQWRELHEQVLFALQNVEEQLLNLEAEIGEPRSYQAFETQLMAAEHQDLMEIVRIRQRLATETVDEDTLYNLGLDVVDASDRASTAASQRSLFILNDAYVNRRIDAIQHILDTCKPDEVDYLSLMEELADLQRIKTIQAELSKPDLDASKREDLFREWKFLQDQISKDKSE